MKVAITGATGLIGSKIVKTLLERKDDVIVLSRSTNSVKKMFAEQVSCVKWNLETQDWYNQLEGVDAVIHLAGENVMGRRWNEVHKKKVLESRTIGTRRLVNAVSSLQKKPHTFVCASAIGFYGNSELPVDENSLPGKDFLADVVSKWEEEAAQVEKYSVRRVSVRIGIVLDKDGGALFPMKRAFNFFLGGPIGSGKQWFPWIHIEDLANIFLFALDNEKVTGAINASSPNPVRMNEFAKTLGRVMNRPSIFRVPEFILKIVLGEGAESVLGGANVQSKRIEGLGYRFKFPNLNEALNNLIN